MLHELIRTWFQWVEQWGYAGIVALMAMESSIVPVPSEAVLPPAAFWASQGKMSFWLVVLAGTVGSFIGSLLSYTVACYAGHPLLKKYGRFVLVSPQNLDLAERWFRQYGAFGIVVARFLPVVRHLISMPAGAFRMPLIPFSMATIVGSALWCTTLAWFGQIVLGESPELLQSPETMVAMMHDKMHWLLGGSIALALLYGLVLCFKVRRVSLY